MTAVSVTGPVNPLTGVTVMVEVDVAPAVTVIAVPLKVKLAIGGGCVTDTVLDPVAVL